jgi:acetolactate synthase regulatory subunit
MQFEKIEIEIKPILLTRIFDIIESRNFKKVFSVHSTAKKESIIFLEIFLITDGI